MSRFLGAHTIDNGGIDKAVLRAASGGMTALQIFTAIPKYYNDRMSIRPERAQRFRAALSTTRIRPEHVLVHGAYVLSVASADEEKQTRARAGLAKELERSSALGVGAVCFHPGAATDGDRERACQRIGKAIAAALRGESPSFFHLNDSEGALGSNTDRHVLIGDGAIGTGAFRWLMADKRTANVPLILETPQRNYDIADDDTSPDPYDVKMMSLLRSFEK